MDIFLYIIIFIIGTFFGSFFTLAVYRIPRKEDILIKHSYCPNCNHKLGFFDLFPILSYLFLKGKCRYCKEKIRPRYLILEIASGLIFLIAAVSLKMNINDVNNIANIVILLLYISILLIVMGIDKENITIQKNVILVGYIIEVLYIIYQYTLENVNVYQYVIYLILMVIILVLSNISLKIYGKEKYYVQILYLMLYMIIYAGSRIFILTTIITLICIALSATKGRKKEKKIPIGFYLSVSNIFIILISNILINYIG